MSTKLLRKVERNKKNMHILTKNQHLLMQKFVIDSEKNHFCKGGLNYAPEHVNQRFKSRFRATHMAFPNLRHLLLLLVVSTFLYVSISAQADGVEPSATKMATSSLIDAGSDLTDNIAPEGTIENDLKSEDQFQRRSSSEMIRPKQVQIRTNVRRDNSDDDTDLGNEDPKFITKEPRQQFKIHLGPTKSQKRSFKSMVAKRQQNGSNNSQTSDATKHFSSPAGNNKVSVKAKSGKQMLSSETLKKLLNQSMLSKNANLYYTGANSLNGTSSSGPNQSGKAGSNFKFVFIQRATAPPNKNSGFSSSNTTKSDSSTSSLSNQSLAASVSKQLATSLLYSAANLVGNLTGAPSLSALTNAVAIKTGASSSNSDLGGATLAQANSNDIRRVHLISASTTPATGVTHAQSSSTAGNHASTAVAYGRKQKPSKRPSKVYNLPVKFVANGQPNGVVFNTIKQHFATIRKMQSASSSSNSVLNRKIVSSSGTKDRRKQQQQHGSEKKKWKGGNSRLIYLPLKYLSNAKPDRLIGPKAAHKSAATTIN